jgi:hypothetical protein
MKNVPLLSSRILPCNCGKKPMCNTENDYPESIIFYYIYCECGKHIEKKESNVEDAIKNWNDLINPKKKIMEKERVVRKTKTTQVECLDQPVGPGNSCHVYQITDGWPGIPSKTQFALINFQKGPLLATVHPNGCQNEDLIAVVIDRLKFFQQGDFACRENAIALTKLEEALMWLEKRTADRVTRGVEGKNEK